MLDSFSSNPRACDHTARRGCRARSRRPAASAQAAELSFSPRSGAVGTPVRVSGSGFRPRIRGIVDVRATPRRLVHDDRDQRLLCRLTVPAAAGDQSQVTARVLVQARGSAIARASMWRRAARNPEAPKAATAARAVPPDRPVADRIKRRRRLHRTGRLHGSHSAHRPDRLHRTDRDHRLDRDHRPTGRPERHQWIPPQHLTWYWQLQGTVNNNEPVAAYDIDGFENSSGRGRRRCTLMGRHVICYIDVGTSENFRPDYASFPASVQGDIERLAGREVAGRPSARACSSRS